MIWPPHWLTNSTLWSSTASINGVVGVYVGAAVLVGAGNEVLVTGNSAVSANDGVGVDVFPAVLDGGALPEGSDVWPAAQPTRKMMEDKIKVLRVIVSTAKLTPIGLALNVDDLPLSIKTNGSES